MQHSEAKSIGSLIAEILRENGTATNAFAIGIRAEVTDRGYVRFLLTLLSK